MLVMETARKFCGFARFDTTEAALEAVSKLNREQRSIMAPAWCDQCEALHVRRKD
mgnify:CR=1 FL=1